jgi:hypothetical protein
MVKEGYEFRVIVGEGNFTQCFVVTFGQPEPYCLR